MASPSSAGKPAKPVTSMTMEEKLAEVVRRSEPRLPPEVFSQIGQLLTPESLALMAGVTIAWAGSHFFGVGEIADVVLLVAGGIMIGTSAMGVGREMYSFALGTKNAQTEQDLDRASEHFARALVDGGVTLVSALFFRSRPKTFHEPFFEGPVNVARGPRGPGLRFKPMTTVDRIPQNPGTVVAGTTDIFGNITVEIRQSPGEILQTLLHERVHQFLTPKLYFLREVRIKFAMEGYNRSYLLRYLEEALAETYSLVKTVGPRATLEGIRFPVRNGYVTVAGMQREVKGVLLGTILVSGLGYKVYAQAAVP